ncbi:MAG: hypothetical protein ACMUJM_08260 [bacterium]
MLANKSAAPRQESLADFAFMHKSYYDKSIAKGILFVMWRSRRVSRSIH